MNKESLKILIEELESTEACLKNQIYILEKRKDEIFYKLQKYEAKLADIEDAEFKAIFNN
jgi:hypothetical protein